MQRKPYGWLAILVGAGLLAGCDLGADSSNKGRTKLVAPGVAPLEPVGSAPKPQPKPAKSPAASNNPRSGVSPQGPPPPLEPLKPAPGPRPGPGAVKPVPPPPGPGMVRIRAEAGVGKRGRYEGEGLLVTPVKAYFKTRQYLELEVKLRHTLDIYANMPEGLPKTADGFMKMCKKNDISLPELPPGETYVWDPAEGKLYVEKPR